MNKNEYIQCDMILRYLWERRNSNNIHIWQEVYSNLKIDADDANSHLQYLQDRDFIEIASKGIGGRDGFEIELTKKGRLFFNDTNLMAEIENKGNYTTGGTTYNVSGHFFSGNNGAIINVDSHFQDAFNKIKSEYNEDSAEALSIIKSMVENSNSTDTVELFNAFNEHLSKPKPNKTMLQTLWGGLTSALPILTQTAGLVEKVMPLIT